jgi:hypothetical protein
VGNLVQTPALLGPIGNIPPSEAEGNYYHYRKISASTITVCVI